MIAEHKYFFDLVWALCQRPRLYTLHGTAAEIWSFIHGLESAYYGRSTATESPLATFGDFLGVRFGVSAHQYWLLSVIGRRELFETLSQSEIWDVFEAFHVVRFGTEYEPITIVPCCHEVSDG